MTACDQRHRVVVVGGGFAGLQAVRALRRAPVDLTLVDRRSFHLLQPLLYQVATGALTAGEIATPLGGILKRQRNARVVLGEVRGFDLQGRRVLLEGTRSTMTPWSWRRATTAKVSHARRRASSVSSSAASNSARIRRRISIVSSSVLSPGAAERHSSWPK